MTKKNERVEGYGRFEKQMQKVRVGSCGEYLFDEQFCNEGENRSKAAVCAEGRNAVRVCRREQ